MQSGSSCTSSGSDAVIAAWRMLRRDQFRRIRRTQACGGDVSIEKQLAQFFRDNEVYESFHGVSCDR